MQPLYLMHSSLPGSGYEVNQVRLAFFQTRLPPLPQTLGVPAPPQVAGEVQVPHELTVRLTPQLSVPETEPQFLPSRLQKAVLVSGVQLPPPQTLGVPPPP